MSLLELLVVLVICFLVIKPSDLPAILGKFKELKLFIFNTKQQLLSCVDLQTKGPLKLNDNDQDIESVNFYLSKIAALNYKYEGDYSIDAIKSYYKKLVNKEIKVRLDNNINDSDCER